MSLNFLFNLNSIAFIDISRKTNSKSRKILANLENSLFLGKIFLINRKAKQISKYICYKNVREIRPQVDLALIFSSLKRIPKVLEECAEKKISWVVIFSDFGKIVNPLNQEYHRGKICQKAEDLNIKILGINSQGILDFAKKINLSQYKNKLEAGDIGLINFDCDLEFILSQIEKNKLGISKIINLGKSFNINFEDVLNFFENDKKTKLVMVWHNKEKISESTLSKLSKILNKKPAIIFSLDKINHKIFQKTGAILSDNLFEFLTISKIFQHSPAINSRNFALLSWDENITNLIIESLKKQMFLLATVPENPKKFAKNNLADFEKSLFLFERNKNIENIIITLPNKYEFEKIIEEKVPKSKKNYFIVSDNLKNNHILSFSFDAFDIFAKAYKKILDYKEYQNFVQSQKRLFIFKNKIDRELKLKI